MLRLTIHGIIFRISLLFPAALVVLLTLDHTGIPAWCVAASAMHEAGHLVAMYALGSRPSEVRVGIFGVSVSHPAETTLRYLSSALVALAGPLVNLTAFITLYCTQGMTVPALVHLVMGVFNLLPVEALDGGQALYYVLAGRIGEQRAAKVGFAVSVAVLLPLATAGFFLLLRSNYNFTLLAVSLYLGLLLLLKRRH